MGVFLSTGKSNRALSGEHCSSPSLLPVKTISCSIYTPPHQIETDVMLDHFIAKPSLFSLSLSLSLFLFDPHSCDLRPAQGWLCSVVVYLVQCQSAAALSCCAFPITPTLTACLIVTRDDGQQPSLSSSSSV